MHLGTFGAGVVEEHLVEWAAQDLPSYRTLVGVGVRKVKGCRAAARLAEKLHAVLAGKGAVFESAEHAEPFERPVGIRHQGLADREAGELLPLKELDLAAGCSDEGGYGAAGGAAADDDDVAHVWLL